MSDHPTPEEIASLCLGTLPDERKGKVAYHVLFQGCEACRAHLSEPFRILLGDEPPAAKAREAQGRRIGDAIRTALRWEKAAAFLEEEGVEGVERARREYGDLEVFEALREKSWSLRHEAPQRMLELAQEAVRIAQELDAVKHGPKKVADHQCRAWANLGNAYRVAQQLARAKACFKRAVELLDLGSGDPQIEIRLLDLQASLAADRRDFNEACRALSFVFKFHQSRRDYHLAGRALISQGIFTYDSGQYDEALRLLQKGLSMVDEEREPSLVLAAVHTELCLLIDCGLFKEANHLYFRKSRLLAGAQDRVNRLKIEWLKGRIYAGLSHFASAERVFREVIDGFLADDVRRLYDSAVASLDLAAVLLSQRQTPEARTLLREAAKTLVDIGLMREAERAVLLLRRAAEMEMADTVLLRFVQEITAFLRRAERDPNARFEPPV